MPVITSLVGYWALNEASGDAIDAHGSNTLTDTNTVTSGTGIVSGARDFEADNFEYFTHTDNTDLSTGDIDFSWQVWVKLESTSDFGLIAKWANPSYEYQLRYINSTSRFDFEIDGGGVNPHVSADNFGAPSLATWYHIICWHDSVNNELGIAVNAGTPNTTGATGGVPDGAGDLQVGARGDGQFPFDGLMDELAFWKKVLTGSERTWLYNSGAGRSYADLVSEAGGAVASILSVSIAEPVIGSSVF